MRFCTQAHQFYCGIDLHARTMYLCILDPQGEVQLHRNLTTTPEAFLKAVSPSATISWLRWNVSSRGIGWLTYACAKASSSCLSIGGDKLVHGSGGISQPRAE